MAKQPTDSASAKAPARLLQMHIPADVIEAGKLLQSFIKQQKLSTQVQGKEFVNVEGWQYAGSLFGWNTKAEQCLNISNDQEIKYQAKVVALNHEGQEVGAGFGICSNKESGKKFYQEFAIASMAQTRAVGKAYRNSLAFLMRLAGFEATPSEEMEYSGNMPAAPAPAPVMKAETTAPQAPTPLPENADAPPVKYATAAQKEEIIRLLNHPLITRQEKTKMLTNMNRLDEERATQAITKLNKAIEDREGTSAVAS